MALGPRKWVGGLDPADPVYVNYRENFEGEPTGKLNLELLKIHPSHGYDMPVVNVILCIDLMKGGKAVLWKDITWS